ncbi:MaoC family dehydratase [Paenochrobactrum glaciei]|uniref:MaoC family dehydratase n=1 Tax=Paenochrobactrum glaciei TaxID=486407 RepID=A0ABN1FX20_9HYPH
MSIIDEMLNKEVILGSFTFTQENIIEFARQFDPQYFHVDPVAAKDSLFGNLCASGWHSASVWMKLNMKSLEREVGEMLAKGETPPVFGPSPGFTNLTWTRPVFAGDTLTYTRTVTSVRALESKPGWSMITMLCTARDEKNEEILRFENAAMIKLP